MTGRKTNGEGSVYKRKDGRWEGAVYLGTVGGKVRRQRVYGKTRAEAHTKLMRVIEEARRGILPPDHVWKVGEYLDFWLEHEKRRALTRTRHEGVVRLHIKPFLGNHRLNSITVRTVQEFLDNLRADGRTVATVHQTRKVLSAALTFAMRQEVIARNPARLVELPRYKSKEAKHWQPDETIAFLDAARADPMYPIFALLALYGLRIGEALGIRWCDIDFEHNVLHIRQQVQRINGELLQVELKTESSERDEPLLTRARQALLQQRRHQEHARTAAGEDWQGTGDDNELAFTTRTGRPLEARNVARSFTRICEQHDLRPITLHGMRHSNATAQKILDVHPRDVQAILGHGDIRTTGIYQHVDLTSKRSALEKLEDRLFLPLGVSVRSRQNYRQTADFATSISAESQQKKTPTPVGEGAFFGSSDWDRTSDLRLMRAIEAPLQERLTSINDLLRTRARTWKFGCVAVKTAVNAANVNEVPENLTLWDWIPPSADLTPPSKEVSDDPTNSAEQEPHQ
ncbi:site-specific integrase [Nocardia sp. BSTN01]|uniref:site-specific integrase n=1 Tax=Nocardia sp. BSTN01 TaxID=2783665 RepID=UPI00188FCC87|nr:site-specific integrase [Nocardia sp. BSTN01]MBF4996699.1 site-specific integrase [Nocardia sp. BSTN01]